MLDWYLHKYILSYPVMQTTKGHTDDTTAVHTDDCRYYLDKEYMNFEIIPLQWRSFLVHMALVCLPGFLQGSSDQADK